ncbi:G8 domain-containing protein, partial [Crocosphaera sp. Alani8]|uniref:G8 domain-containing protein n=1 Tax=Crocosphaera sp. Alani8 TaxID=3038952 RepID=UPI00313AF9A7
GTLTFGPNETSKTFSVALIDDSAYEGDETFKINLSNPTGDVYLASNSATGVIFENDSEPSDPNSDSAIDSGLPQKKIMEQTMLLNIVPDGSQTHQAVNNGSWFDASTWANGVIPTAGARVYIPANLTVQYDSESNVPLWTVRVDGTLNFSRTQNTKMVVDTLAIMNNGQLNIGRKGQAISGNVEAEIVFADDERALNDPMAKSLGLVSIGEVNIHGQEKAPHLKVTTDPMQGDTSLTLSEVPSGWEIGDRIVLTGTEFNPDWYGGSNLDQSQDEVLTITQINGQTIIFDKPLKFDHDTPRADLKASVANLSRNVVLRSEVVDDISKRGHTMFMHSDDVDIRYAHFQELGRTDKSRTIDNSTDNKNGRYSLHLHQQGVALDNNPAIIVGNSLEGSPGWGYVQHGSFAVMDHNVAFDVFGGAFIAEGGDETGRWEDNIAIKGTGLGRIKGAGHPKDAKKTLTAANNGTGYYFQSRLVHNQNNIAASMPGFGFLYFHRRTANSVEWIDSSTLEETLTSHGKSYTTNKGVSIDSPSLQGFANNEAFATYKGLSIIKDFANQHHDGRTVLDGFTAWEVQNGADVEYTGHYTLNNFDLIAHDTAKNYSWDNHGLELGQKMVDIVVNDLRVDGFTNGLKIIKTNTIPDINNTVGNNILIDYNPKNYTKRIETSGHKPNYLIELNEAPTIVDKVEIDFNSSADLNIGNLGWNEIINLQGTKTDSLGSAKYGGISSHAKYQNFYDIDLPTIMNNGYYTLPNNKKAIILSELTSDRLSGQSYVKDVVLTIKDSLINNNIPFLGQLNATDANNDGIWNTNSAPQAAFDSVKVDRNSSVVFSVLSNDTDIDGDTISLSNFTNVGDGNLELINAATGTFRYTPNANYDGYDYFTYTIVDSTGSGRSRTGSVELKIDTI